MLILRMIFDLPHYSVPGVAVIEVGITTSLTASWDTKLRKWRLYIH